MRFYKQLVSLCVVAFLVSCSNKNDEMLKVIPADAVGVVSVDVPNILEKSGMLNESGDFSMPESLQTIVDENDESTFSKLLIDLPEMGVDYDCKIFSFYTLKTFGSVVLMGIDDEDAARKVIERRAGKDFADVDGLNCISVGDDFYALHDGIFFHATVNKPQEVTKLSAAARNMLARTSKSILDNSEVMECLNAENDVNAYMLLDGVKFLSKRSKTYKEMSEKFPLVDIFVESDIKAYVASANLNEDAADLEVKILADDNSEYVQLLSGTLGNPSADFLKSVPESMENIVSMSVKGEKFVELPQIAEMIETFKNTPFIGRLDIESILKTIDGPVAMGMAKDPNLDDWNAVVTACSTTPDEVLNQLKTFAASLGQQPEIYDNEYIYEYDNKMVKLGNSNGSLYMKMLNYEQTEGYAYDNVDAREFFSKTPMGIYVRAKDNKGGSIKFGLVDIRNIKGSFIPAQKGTNAIVALLQVLCGIEPVREYEDRGTDELEDVLPVAIDELKPVN